MTVLDGHDRYALGAVVNGPDAAPEGVGIARFRGIVMTDNDPTLKLLSRYAPGLRMARVDGHLDVEVPLLARHAAAAM